MMALLIALRNRDVGVVKLSLASIDVDVNWRKYGRSNGARNCGEKSGLGDSKAIACTQQC